MPPAHTQLSLRRIYSTHTLTWGVIGAGAEEGMWV